MYAHWRLGRRPALDGLRGVAIALVMASHLCGARYLGAGSIGVTIFFGLSGFLITALLVEEHLSGARVRLRRFYLRRAARLLPALLVALIAVAAVENLEGDPDAPVVTSVLLYVSNWAAAIGHPMGLLVHTWSLAVEEQFYVVWPVLLLCALRRTSLPRIAVCCALLGAGALILRLLLWHAGAPLPRLYYGTDTRADALLFGCAAALATYAGWRPRPSLRRLGAVVLVLAPLFGLIPGGAVRAVLLPTLTALAVPALLAVGLDRAGALANPVLGWLGRRSYAIYLWHVPLIYGLEWYVHPSELLRVLGAAIACVIAEVSWRLVESPILRRVRTPRVPAVTTSAVAVA